MTNKFIRLCLPTVLLGIGSLASAYDGRTTVTKQTEVEHDIHFDVAFLDREGLLQVTITAPQKVYSLSLSGFSVAQLDGNGKTTLRVPISSAKWKLTPDVPSPDGKERSRVTVAAGFDPKVTLSVSLEKLPETKLEARYGGFDSGWTYLVDLSSYRSKTKPALARETTIKDADNAATLTESLGIEKFDAATVIDSPYYGHSLQSPLDATYSAPEGDRHSTELMKLLADIDQKTQSQRFRDRPGPLSKPRESSWRNTSRDRDKIMAAVKAFDSGEPSIGDPEDWQWDDAEVYVDGQGNYMLWVFFRSMNRGKIWRWVTLDSEAKRIESSGWGAG